MLRRTAETFAIAIAIAIAIALSACGSDTSTPAGTSAAPSASSAPSAKPSASAAAVPTPAPSVSAAASDVDPCKKHSLTLGGAGTRADMCKYDGDVLTAKVEGALEDAGAVAEITNPWAEDVTSLQVAVFYYDKAGKQLTPTVEGKEQRSSQVNRDDVKVAGNKATKVTLGFAKKDLPADVDTVEVQILSFGIDLGGGKTGFYTSTTPYNSYRGIHGGDGPTGIAECDQYRAMLESCPTKFPDALTAMQKSLRGYNNAAPKMQQTMVEGLTKACVGGIESSKARCTPD